MTLEKPSDPSSFDCILPNWIVFFKNPSPEPIFWGTTSFDVDDQLGLYIMCLRGISQKWT